MKTFKAPYNGYMERTSTKESEDVEFPDEIKADWIVYSYMYGCYEGSGNAIIKKDGKFYQEDLGHCSCYGPTERLEFKKPFDTLEDLLSDCSEELKIELTPLVEVIKKEELQ